MAYEGTVAVDSRSPKPVGPGEAFGVRPVLWRFFNATEQKPKPQITAAVENLSGRAKLLGYALSSAVFVGLPGWEFGFRFVGRTLSTSAGAVTRQRGHGAG